MKPKTRAALNFLLYLPEKDSCTTSVHQASIDSHIKYKKENNITCEKVILKSIYLLNIKRVKYININRQIPIQKGQGVKRISLK